MSLGLPASDLGDLCLREIAHIMRGAAHRDRVTAWMQGQYVMIAQHNPKEYPKCPELEAPRASNPVVSAEIDAIRRRVKLAHDTAKAMKRNGR